MQENILTSTSLKNEIIFSKAIKAGKRIYYVDVKQGKNDMFLAVTESKKVVTGEGTDARVCFEKHKIFIYKEDFSKVLDGLSEAVSYIEERQGKAEPRKEKDDSQIKINIEF